jgi:hypothetical protein
MNKLLSSVGLAIALAAMSLLAGCQLYFGDRDDRSGGRGGDGNPPGFECKENVNCAAGCFCSNGICEEAGFCGSDRDCGTGFRCDVARSSCVPGAACKCLNDADAIRQGAGWCDETNGTCQQGQDPAGACLGAITCTNAAPKCPEGQVPLHKDGCFTGACRAINVCEAAPTCNSLQHENDCTSRSADCGVVTIGRGCRRGDGTPCQPGDSATVCTCERYDFAACEDKGPMPTPRTIFE